MLDLHGTTVELNATGMLEEASSSRATGGTLTATRTLNSPAAINVGGLGAVLSSSANLGDVTVTRGHAIQTGGSNQSIERYYDITVTGTSSGLSATLTHFYHDAELNGLSESDLVFFSSTDGGFTWSKEGADSRDASANTVTLTGIASFSRWTLASASSPLPVDLASFSATVSDDRVRLEWKTASETDNARFVVQRKGERSGGQWRPIGSVEGGGTTSQPQTYRFTDGDLPYAADSLSYRLEQVDAGGAVHVSDPVTVARRGIERLQLEPTYPNPARGRVTVRFAVRARSDADAAALRLYDVLGRRVQSVRTGVRPGRHEVHLPVHDLASGVYVLRLERAGQTRHQRLTVLH